MKIAILVTGEHFSGKSKTINKYLKPLLGISSRCYRFSVNGKEGFIISQTIEESGKDLAFILGKCKKFDLVVIATRIVSDPISKHSVLKAKLSQAGFKCLEFLILDNQRESFYRNTARDMFLILK